MYAAKKKTINGSSTTRCEEFEVVLARKPVRTLIRENSWHPNFHAIRDSAKSEFSGATTNRQKDMTAAL
jgi:hypothetical protein